MYSMTGFGAVEIESNNLKLSIRIRAVNGRFLELRTQLPSEYYSLESELKKKLNESLKRGTVDLYIYRRAGGDKAPVKVHANENFAKEWMSTYKNLAKALGLKEDLSMSQLAKVPQVLRLEDLSVVDDNEKEILFRCLEKAIENCQIERSREGLSIAADLEFLLNDFETKVLEITKLKTQVDQEIEKRYKDKLEKQMATVSIDPQRIAQELVIQIDKLDITEELFRLREHIKVIRQIAFNKEEPNSPVGKKLDFYSQELLREINTIGSKCQNATVTKYIVDSKGLIERFREIVQNVE